MEFTRNQKKAHDLNRHISVTAGAGSGKTAVLIHRYIKILLETDLHPSQVVAITFTRKAAAELKQRIIKELDVRLREEPDNTKLKSIKTGMLSAQISTIHSFCARILREYPVEAGVDAGFSELQGIQQRLTLRDTIDSTLREIAERPDEDETRARLVELLRIFGKGPLERHLNELVNQREAVDRLVRGLYSHTDSEVLDTWREFVQLQLAQSLKNQFPIEDWLRCLRVVLTVARGRDKTEVQELTDQIKPSMEAHEAVPLLIKIAPLLVTQKGTISKQYFLGRNVKIEAIDTEIGFLVRAANYFRSFPVFTDDDKLLICVTRSLLAVYNEVQDAYEQHKVQTGQLDFDDLQIKVRDLLWQESIHEQLAQRYPYIMVDEYQDTDQLQYEILDLLAVVSDHARKHRPSDSKLDNLFIVGDQKQSIYGFRGADVRVFGQTRQDITDYQSGSIQDFAWQDETLAASDSERHGELHLPENFRLLRNLVGFVNLVFGSLMKGQNEFEVKYESLIQGRIIDYPGDVELLIGSTEAAEDNSQPPIDENELIAARICHLVGTRETIWTDEGDGEKPRPIRYSDIAILIRSRTHLPKIESALLDADIPYRITGGIGFYQRQEIYDIGNYLQFLINPNDDVALAGVLRAPFFGVSDVELYEITQPPTTGSFWQKVQAYAAQPPRPSSSQMDYVVQMLQSHLEICHHIPPSELIRKIVNDTGLVGVLPVGQSGEQRWANYEKLLGIARDFERLGMTNLFDFLEQLNLLIEEEEREGQATTELTADAVEIMTVHAAKGLEFPVVILPNLDQGFRPDGEPFIDDRLGIGFKPTNPAKNYEKSDPGATQLMRNRARNRTEAEEQRLFYVATTRARDRLILSGTADKKGNTSCWLNWLLDALEIPEIPSEGKLLRPTKIEVSSGEKPKEISFVLPIRIIKSLDELDFVEEEVPVSPPSTEFPAYHIEPLVAASTNKTFSVSELATYAHCPTRFYLQHHIQMPISEPQLEAATETARKDINQFLDSKVAEMALNADEIYRERHIQAEIGSHIVEGIADRFFKDSTGFWQVINYERDGIDWEGIGDTADYYRSEIELYALLLHWLYPEQRVMPVTIYSTDHATPHSAELSREQLMDIERAWLERIEEMQVALNADAIGVGRFEKNRDHCPLCPYFVDGECMVAD